MYESNDKMVSHPEHYQSKNGLEVIDVIEAFTSDLNGIEATDTGNILKYACRWKRKNGVQDLKKIMWYTQHLIDHLEESKDHKTDDKIVLNICGLKVGDKINIPLGNLGTFMATLQKITDDEALFIFDDYVAKRPMNEDGDNIGGYSQSDLKKWIDTELYNMFPAVLKQRMTGLSIPTLGEICGWDDEWDRNNLEADGDEQLPLMK